MRIKDRNAPDHAVVGVRRSLLRRPGVVLLIGNRPYVSGRFDYADVELTFKDARRLAKEIIRLADESETEEAA